MPLAQELQKLQTSVPCDDAEVVRETIATELDKPLDELFVDFDTTPLASASIGQAHRARLPGGDDVVVKVQHAGIRRRMEVDLDILAGLAQLAEKLPELAAVPSAGDRSRVPPRRAARARFRPRGPQPRAVQPQLRPRTARPHSATVS